MDDGVCNVCGQPATVYLTEVHDGEQRRRSLCAEHAGQLGLTEVSGGMTVNGVACSSVEEAVMRGVLDNLRGTANCIRRHGRMPESVEELVEETAVEGDFPAVALKDARLKGELERLERFIRFCETRGRLPTTPDEMRECGLE